MALGGAILILSVIIGIIAFIGGFMLVYVNLRRINLIEREKFNLEDYFSCLVFASIFAAVFIITINLFYGLFNPETVEGEGFLNLLMTLLVLMILLFPIYNMIVLSRPTSDATTKFDKMLETKILDRLGGRNEKIALVILFFILYLLPPLIIGGVSEKDMSEMIYLWFIFIPLIFLNTFSASGQVAGIISTTYLHKHHYDPREEKFLLDKVKIMDIKAAIKKIIHFIIVLIAWVPFLTGFYSIYNAFSRGKQYLETGNFSAAKEFSMLNFIVLIVQIFFAVYGFFKKYWSKKSKTKTIDFMFSAWIFTAISINILINFSLMSTGNVLLGKILGNYAFLEPLYKVLSDPLVVIGLLSVQGFIMVFYGGFLLFHRNSDFHADLKISAINRIFGLRKIQELEELRKKMVLKKKKSKDGQKLRIINVKDPNVLVKSVLLEPMFNRSGVDLNENVRKRAAQYLFLIAYDDKEKAKKIVDAIARNTIEYSPTNLKDLSIIAKIFGFFELILIKLKIRPDIRSIYFSKEAIDLLGNIGREYPDIVTQKLINAIDSAYPELQQEIFDALGDIGENKANISEILEKLRPFMLSKMFNIRKSANQAIAEMVMEGDYNDEEFTGIVLSYLYSILEENPNEGEIVENVLELILNLTEKISKQIDVEKIYPFIEKASDGGDLKASHQIREFILQYAINIVGYCVYYNLESFPFDKIIELTGHRSPNVRYVAIDAVGNYLLNDLPNMDADKQLNVKNDVLAKFLKISLEDEDPDVRDMAIESIAEFLIMNTDDTFRAVKIDGKEIHILDYLIENLSSDSEFTQNNASEALKGIAPVLGEQIYKRIEPYLLGENLEIRRDLMEMLGYMPESIHREIDLDILFQNLEHENSRVRELALFALGCVGENRPNDIDEDKIIARLDDEVLNVRLNAIFALGKIGSNKDDADKIIEALILKFFRLDRSNPENVSEIELYAESLGIIGATHPANEIIISLQQALMGDTHILAKDVIAKALYAIGEGMVKRGNAKRVIESEAFYNQVSWLAVAKKEQYTIGNLVIMLIEAMQLKGIPDSVMNEISDSLQDLLPAFLFVKQKKPDEILLTIKKLLQTAYYSNYNQEILETIDRIDSLISFKSYFEVEDEDLKRYSLFLAQSHTPDGKQFYDQGVLFMMMDEGSGEYMEYALKSFEIAIELAPNEFYTPDCYLQMGLIYKYKGDIENAKFCFSEALEAFASLDNIEKMKETQQYLDEIGA